MPEPQQPTDDQSVIGRTLGLDEDADAPLQSLQEILGGFFFLEAAEFGTEALVGAMDNDAFEIAGGTGPDNGVFAAALTDAAPAVTQPAPGMQMGLSQDANMNGPVAPGRLA